jgi:hypothetical protein
MTIGKKIAFGKLLSRDRCKQWCAELPELKAALDACREPHQRLHTSAVTIREAFASASASEQLSAQAQTAKGIVDELVVIVGGSAGGSRSVAVNAGTVGEKQKAHAGLHLTHLQEGSQHANAEAGHTETRPHGDNSPGRDQSEMNNF